MPDAVIRSQSGQAAEDYFRRPIRFSASAQETVERVASGELEVGVVPHHVFDELLAEGDVDPRSCRVIWKSGSYPDAHFVAHPDLEFDLGPNTIDRIEAALVELDDAAVLRPFRCVGFQPVTDSDFVVVAEAARRLAP